MKAKTIPSSKINFKEPQIISNPDFPEKWMGMLTQKELKQFAELAVRDYVEKDNAAFDKAKFNAVWKNIVKKITERMK